MSLKIFASRLSAKFGNKKREFSDLLTTMQQNFAPRQGQTVTASKSLDGEWSKQVAEVALSAADISLLIGILNA